MEDLSSDSQSHLCSRRLQWALGELQQFCGEVISVLLWNEVYGTGRPERNGSMNLLWKIREAFILRESVNIPVLKFRVRRKMWKSGM